MRPQARQAVIKAKEEGADFLKVYSYLPREAYFAIADEATKQGIPFEGHVPDSVSAEEASNAGQKTFEHLLGVLPACSTWGNEWDKAALGDLLEQNSLDKPTWVVTRTDAIRQLVLDGYSSDKAAALFALLKKNETWQCPTLTVLHKTAFINEPYFSSDPRLKYVPRETRARWYTWTKSKRLWLQGDNLVYTRKEFEKNLEIVGAMQRAGVGILAGTDQLNAYCFPGFSLHDELGLLVEAGLSPLEALQAATLNPAGFMGREKDLGTIEKGKLADLVLLDANPLGDIGNTRRINAVVVGRQLFPKPALDEMLAKSEAWAGK